jgi:predicted DNA-binding transcriptional regulator AlpA
MLIAEHQQRGRRMGRKYLKVTEAAEMLGISTKAAWQRLYRGELPYKH